MNQFSRFLFVGSVLFILLGLYEKQSGNVTLSQPYNLDVKTETVQEGILLLNDEIFEHSMAGGSVFKILHGRAVQKENKVIISILNSTQYKFLINRFARYRSELMDRTGQHFHFQHSREIPAIS